MIVRFAVAGSSLAALLVPVPAAATEGAPLDRPVWTSELKGFDSFDAVVAPDKDNAWAFGRASRDPRGKPIAYRRTGGGWKAVELPGGLRGGIEVASASSASNVWAVGSDLDAAKPTYLLHWDGKRWKLVRRWDAGNVRAVIARGKKGVLLFDYNRPRALSFDGTRWHRSTTPIPVWGAAAKGRTVWASGFDAKDRARVFRFDGRRWKSAGPGKLLPKVTAKSATFLDAPVIVGKAVWLTGSYLPHFTDDDSLKGMKTLLFRYGNGRWHTEKPDPAFLAGGLGGPVAASGGDLWFVGIQSVPEKLDEQEEHDAYLVHRSPSGAWTRTYLGHSVAGSPVLESLVRVPGTRRFLGVGNDDKGDAAVFEFG